MQRAAADTGAAAPAAAGGSTNARVVIASGIEARSLATKADTAAAESARQGTLYVTAADQPNRLFSLSSLGASTRAATAGANPMLAPIVGVGTAGSLGDGGMAAAAELDLKLDSLSMRSGVAVAADGTIFVADTRNATIRRIAGPASSEPGVIRSVAGRWAPRQNIELVEPMGMALDRAGNLYIADHGANSVLILRAAAAQASGPLELLSHVALPASIAVTSDGSKVFAASPENGAVFAIEPRTHGIQAVAGFVRHASACPSSAPARKEQTEACPAGLAADGGGNIFAADAIANHIIRVDAQTAAVTVAAADLSAPGDISFDVSGNLFIAEQGREQLVEIRGLGVPANSVTLSPLANDFGVEPTHGISPTTPFTLTNGTNAPLTALNVSAYQGANPGDFQTASTSCLATLPANTSCVINVALAPADVGPLSAQLVVTYTGAANPVTANVTGTGAGYSFDTGTQPTTAVVTAGNKATYNLQITPDSNFPATSPYMVTLVCPPIESPAVVTTPPGFLPALTTCTFTPATATITPGTAIPITFVVETTSRTTGVLGSVPTVGRGSRPRGRWGPPLFPSLVLILTIALFWILGTMYGRGTKKIRIVSIVTVFVAVAALVGGCGGGGGKKILGTPAGKAEFLVQATVQNAQGTSLSVTRGVALELIVQ